MHRPCLYLQVFASSEKEDGLSSYAAAMSRPESQPASQDWDLVSDAGGPQTDATPRAEASGAAQAARPRKPTDLDVKVRPDKSFKVCWKGDAECFKLLVRYFRFGGPMIDREPDHETSLDVHGCQQHVQHPEEIRKDQAWVVKLSLKSKSESGNLFSDAITKQIAFDDELDVEVNKEDLNRIVGNLEKNDLQSFREAKKQDPSILLLGGQHHGKSSLSNHLYRFLTKDLGVNDQMDVAPAGKEEKTVATKGLTVPVGSRCLKFIDTPAFANMNSQTIEKLKVLLSKGIQDGTRRDSLPSEWSFFQKPPHGAIVVMSLCHWRDQTSEMQSYLQKMAETFQNASSGTVAFPYVVACTHRDVFLEDCQKDDPAEELENAVKQIKTAANAEHVHIISSYKKGSAGSARNNQATYDLLSELLTKAKHENTGQVQEERWSRVMWSALVIGVVAAGTAAVLNRA